MAEYAPYPNDPIQRGQIRARERELTAERNFWRSMTFLFGILFLGTAGIVIWWGAKPLQETLKPVASANEPEPDRGEPERSAEARRSFRSDAERDRSERSRSSSAPISPGVTLGFDDIENACGDLSYLPSYLCLVNRGSEEVVGGARLVLTEQQATFEGRSTHHNGVSVRVTGKERYRLEFGPPKGKALIPGLYTEAMRWPFNEGPHPGMDVSIGSRGCNKEDGQFRILELTQSESGEVRRLVVDFETSCSGATGRLAIEQLGVS